MNHSTGSLKAQESSTEQAEELWRVGKRKDFTAISDLWKREDWKGSITEFSLVYEKAAMGRLGDDESFIVAVAIPMRMPFHYTVLGNEIDDIIIVLEHIESYHGS